MQAVMKSEGVVIVVGEGMLWGEVGAALHMWGLGDDVGVENWDWTWKSDVGRFQQK